MMAPLWKIVSKGMSCSATLLCCGAFADLLPFVELVLHFHMLRSRNEEPWSLPRWHSHHICEHHAPMQARTAKSFSTIVNRQLSYYPGSRGHFTQNYFPAGTFHRLPSKMHKNVGSSRWSDSGRNDGHPPWTTTNRGQLGQPSARPAGNWLPPLVLGRNTSAVVPVHGRCTHGSE